MTLGELLVKIKVDKGDTESSISGISDRLKSLNILGIASVGIIGGMLVKGFKDCVAAAAESELVVSKLNSVLKATAGVSGVTSASAQKLASALENVTAFDDEAIMSGETLLLTFRNIGEKVFPQATEAALDLATIIGTDVTSAARMVGKALDNPSEGLMAIERNVGKLSPALKNQIAQFMALGDVASAQKIVMEALAVKMGGAARAAAETYSGRLAQLNNAFGNLKETIGNLFIGSGGEALAGMTKIVKDITDGLNKIQLKYAEFQYFLARANKIVALGEYENARAAENVTKTRQNLINIIKEQLKVEKEGGGFKPPTDKPKEYQDQADKVYKIWEDYRNRLWTLNQNFDAIDAAALDKVENEIKGKKVQAAVSVEEALAVVRETARRTEEEKAKAAAIKNANTAMQLTQQMVSGLGQIYSMYLNNKTMALDNDLFKGNERIQSAYDAERLSIENSTLNQKEKDAALKALDEKKARESQALSEKIEKQKRKVTRDAAKNQKVLAISDVAMRTAQAIMGAWASVAGIAYPGNVIIGGILSAMFGAMGAAQIELIRQQPLPAAAKGGVFDSPYVGGEAGREMAIPLEGPNGRNAIQQLASGILDVMSQSVDNRASISNSSAGAGASGGDVYLDGSLVGQWMSKASDNGLYTINKKVVI